MATDQRISLEPTNPVQGGTVTICYEFTDSQTTTRLQVTFFPYGTAATHEVTPEEPCITLQVPATAFALLVEDLDGPSPDHASAIVPGAG